MTKHCLGCGILLQTKNKNELGYTKEETMDYCMRCFRIQNYHDYQNAYVSKENEELFQKLAKQKGIVFFFADFLNLHFETIRYYKRIKMPKIFIVNKIDIIPKSISFLKIKSWLQEIYEITEPIFFTNSKSSPRKLIAEMKKYKGQNIFLVGITNAGKSSIVKKILEYYNMNQKVTVSDLPNTTLDFIKIKLPDEINIIDTPGLTYHAFQNEKIFQEVSFQKTILPKTYPIKEKCYFHLNQAYFEFSQSSITWYGSEKLMLQKIYKLPEEIAKTKKIEKNVSENTLLMIKGVGFFTIKEKGKIKFWMIKEEEIDICPSFFQKKN